MIRPISLTLFLAILCLSARAQTTTQERYQAGYLAWDVGDYPDALKAFQNVLSSPDGRAYLEDIALLTGELYQTTEIAPDGSNPTWSADGSHFMFQSEDDGDSVIQVMTAGGNELARAHGFEPSLSSTGDRMAFLSLEESDEFRTERDSIRENIEVVDRASFFRYRNAMTALNAAYSRVNILDTGSDKAEQLATPDMAVYEVQFSSDGTDLFMVASQLDSDSRVLYRHTDAGPEQLAMSDAPLSDIIAVPGGRYVVASAASDSLVVVDLRTTAVTSFQGNSPAISADGTHLTFIRSHNDSTDVIVMPFSGEETTVFSSHKPISNPALSPDGSQVIFQHMPRENQELFLAQSDGSKVERLTYDVQHDLFPRFISDHEILGVVGEGRHRRSYVLNLESGIHRRLHHNNTTRTVAPEYEWSVSGNGMRILIVAERDGNTISPERGLYLVDRSRRLSVDHIRSRLSDMMEAESELRTHGETVFAPVHSTVESIVSSFSTTLIYGYESDLFSFGSKYITEPGNAEAIDYLVQTLRSFGYEPELQWFEPRDGTRTANVIATLPGTVDPDLIYVVSSHFDSVQRGPGADDNTSATSALLEVARTMREHPQPATIKFAFFTGEEAGLLGSREFVRRAVEHGDVILGALNNDMVGYANDNRLDNTIRYSNDGIRDIQHAAAFLFTDMITYDARYYKFTDAHAYYEAYGDIVGGIGSYPILANPHYHQSHDVLETINHQLVTEVGKTTAATLIVLSNSPARLKNLAVDRTDDQVFLTWTPSYESSVQEYRGRYRNSNNEEVTFRTIVPEVTLENVPPGADIRVRAINNEGLTSWDWARIKAE